MVYDSLHICGYLGHPHIILLLVRVLAPLSTWVHIVETKVNNDGIW